MYAVFEQLCQEKGVKPYRVSKETGVSQTTLSRWKTSGKDPERDVLLKLAIYFNTTVDFLISGDERARYYLDNETAQIATFLYNNHKLLFEALKDSRQEDVDFVIDYLNRVKPTNRDE